MNVAKFLSGLAIFLAMSFAGHPVLAQTISVREIRVTGESDGIFGGALEVEVHMYWQFSPDSVQFLGCSGQAHGLEHVDVSDIQYIGLSGFFQKPAGGSLQLVDVANKNIFLITAEDDSNPCPVPYGLDFIGVDDLIGKSEIFSGAELANLKLTTFGNVKHLLIGAGDYTLQYKFTNQSQVIGNRADASNGGCWGDFDNDGDPDLFIPNGRSFGTTNDRNQLFLNFGDGSFQEVKTGPVVTDDGNSTGCTCADYDNDGDVDLFVTNDGPNFLYANNGNATFTKITTGPVVTDNFKSTGAAWGDYDNDGDLDLFVANGDRDIQKNSFYINNGNGTFRQADSTNIVVSEASSSTGCNWVDYDGDDDVDLFVTNTNNQRNFLYRNLGGGAFQKISSGVLVTDNKSSSGASWADYDNDGDQDVLVANGSGQSHDLYINDGRGAFARKGLVRGFSSTFDTTGVGSSWGDFDNDGDRDLFTSFYTFTNQLPQGELQATAGYGVSVSGRSGNLVDYDNDGALDFFAARFRLANLLYRNDGGDNNWLKVRCRGTVSNRSAIGAKVRAKAVINGKPVWQLHEISSQTGHAAQNGLEAHFGLAQAAVVDSLVIHWPGGSASVLANVAVNKVLEVTETIGTRVADNTIAAPTTFALAQNYPNPFNPSTTIKYELPQQVEVKLEIYDLMGRRVRTLVNQRQQAGQYAITWDGRNEQGQAVASGTFIYQLRAGTFMQVRRMALVR